MDDLEIGAEELDERMLRTAVSGIASECSAELAAAGADLAGDLSAAGVADVATGAGELVAATA